MSDKLDRNEYFKMYGGDKLFAKVPLIRKKSFDMRVVLPHKMRNCGECKKGILCENCNKLVNQKKDFSSNPNEMKREPPKLFGHMLPKYITI